MSDGWSGDLSHGHYRRLLAAAAQRFRVLPLAEVEEAASDEALLLLRHDVDLCPSRAAELGRVEHALGVRATYHLMVSSPLYDPAAATTRAAVDELASLGHEIGLHFDAPGRGDGPAAPLAELEEGVARQCEELERVIGAEVRSVSFHRPDPRWLRGPARVAGRLNAYRADWMGWYLSDSAGRFREGPPLDSLAEQRGRVLQLLVHPIWWGAEHQDPRDRLESFFLERTAGMDPEARHRFDAALAATTPRVRRRGATENREHGTAGTIRHGQ